MRASVTDYSNISKEIVGLKQNFQSVKAKIVEKKTHLDRINNELTGVTDIINTYQEKQNNETEDERSDQDKIRENMNKLNDDINLHQAEKNQIIQQYREEQKIMDAWQVIKKNLEWAKRKKQNMEQNEEERKKDEEEVKKKKENQMSKWEVNTT